jgi:hypothetical protein
LPNSTLIADVVHVGGLFPVQVELDLYLGELTSPLLAPVRAALTAAYAPSLLALTGTFQINAGIHNPLEALDNALQRPAASDIWLWIDITRDGEPAIWVRTRVPLRIRRMLEALAAAAANGMTNIEFVHQLGHVTAVRDLNRLRSAGVIIGSHLLGPNPDQHDRIRVIRRFVLGSEISFSPPAGEAIQLDMRDVAEAIGASGLIRTAHRLRLQHRAHAGIRRAASLFDRPLIKAIREGRLTPDEARLAAVMPGLHQRLAQGARLKALRKARAAKRPTAKPRHSRNKKPKQTPQHDEKDAA